MSAKRENPYTLLQRDVRQFIDNIWRRRKTALFSVDVSDWARGQMDAAESLGHTLVLTPRGGTITVQAVPRISTYDVPYAVRPNHIEGAL